ncbi:MAG: DUF481 domain-containing protein [Bacteroidales bacterium]|nr:DUF481 domain-containing protein [Bacteroidales bacterium]
MFKKIILVLLFYIFWQSVDAQVVNVEKKRKGDKEGFQGKIGLGFQLLDNGKSVMQFNNNIDLQYRKGAHLILLLNDLNMMRVDDENIVNSGFQHLRYNYTIKDSSFLQIDAFGQSQYNSIKLLTQRFVAGLGPRFRLLNTDQARVYIGAPVMYEYEKLSDSLTTITRFIRLDVYASISWDITQSLKLKSITYYQPHISRFVDYRISSETIFSFKITDKLAFNTGFEATYDSEPPEDIQKLFYYWRNKLSFLF